ncbi:MAG: tripartite tricarboxylate transporter substrate binding protein [Chloroflexota bacterium]
MKRHIVLLTAAIALATLVIAGCSQAAPPAPTQAPAAKAAEPTKAAAPTTAPAPTKKVDFPEKGKSVSLIIGYPAGGGADIAARVLQPVLEKELGVPVQVVNRAGAGSQVAITSVATAKPDGYTIGYANWPTMITIYLDPERKAAFDRKDLQPLSLHVSDPMAIAVKADSPIKSIKDLLDEGKAKPGTVKVGTSGILSHEDLSFRQMEKETGAKLNIIAFDGASPAVTALLGGHIDAVGLGFSSMLSSAKSGQTRIIATLGSGGDQFLPGTKSMEDQGYKGYFSLGRGWFLPAGTPKEVVDVLDSAFKKAMGGEEHKKKIMEVGQVTTYKGPEDFGKWWDAMEATVKPLMELAKQQQK